MQEELLKSMLTELTKLNGKLDNLLGSRTVVFKEEDYLEANPDVKEAVTKGQFTSGHQHYKMFGQYENRITSNY